MDTVRFARYSGETAKIIFAPLFIGLARGYFVDVDVEVDDLDLREQPWETVAAGRADCGAGNVDYCVNPKWAGRMKAALVHEQFRAGHGLTSLLARRQLIDQGRLTADPSTMRGLTIALPSERGDDFLAFHGALRQGRLTIDDVRIAPAGHGESEDLGGVDIKIGRRPRGVAREIGPGGEWARWKQGDELFPDLQARYLLFSNGFMAGRPDVGARFLAAYLRGARDYCDAFDRGIRKQELIDLLVEETGETAELLNTMKPLGFSPNGVIDEPRLEGDIAILREHDLVPAGTRTGDVMDNRFAERALESLGRYA
jgi:NitT/TauT family transport system substrate-binding protein